MTVLDWDFLALGDPMWDLAYLLEQDMAPEKRPAIDIEAVTRAYGELRPLDPARLAWHLACFEVYWAMEGQAD